MRTTQTTLLFALAAAACSDQTVKVYHEPPVVAIIEPADGATVYEGANVTFRAQVSTIDGSDLSDITHQWVADSDVICVSEAVPADGFATCVASFDDPGSLAVTVTATNSRGDRGTSTVDLVVANNEPPTVELITPSDGDVLSSNDLVVISATIGDFEDDADELIVSVTSSTDGDLSVPENGTTSGQYSGSTFLTGGAHLITITVTDTAGKSAQDTATVRVNDPPSAPVVEITPGSPLSEEQLTATIVTPSTDPEGDTITYRYDWHVNGDPTPYSSGTNPNLSRGVTQRDEFWEVYVYAYDQSDYGNPGIASVTIGNAAPSIDSLTVAPTTPYTVDDVVATPVGFYDPEGDREAYRWVWYHNGSVDSSETTDTFPYSKTTKGDTVRVEATPYDSFLSGTTVSSASITIVNSPPTQPGVSISPSSPEPEDALVCTVSSRSFDDDNDSVTYTYEWLVDGAASGITSYTVPSSATAHGEVWECQVTPDDGEDTGSYGSTTVTIADVTAPGAPSISGVSTYSNDEEINISTICEADCDLTYYFSDSTGSWTESAVCGSSGNYTHTSYLTRGYETDIYATCTDSAGNTSSASNTLTGTACDPEDTYEALGGDSGATAIGGFSTLNDSGSTTITITGNALTTADEDWYTISATDNRANDISAGLDAFNFQIDMNAGSSTYGFRVYEGGYTSANLVNSAECGTGSYQEFDYYNEDQGDGGHGIPSDTRTCDSGNTSNPSTGLYNECEDYTATYYVRVTRNSSAAASCQHYELEITNGLAP
ncbi:MAG: hypothetical protein H6741_03275 [Alphaproteobacteria bacterium]|nr:hypothetical protein [Alphaproteobacteria bacterium]